MPRTQAEWNAYDEAVDAGKAPDYRSARGAVMSERYLAQSIKPGPKGKGFVIGRVGDGKVFPSRKAARDDIGYTDISPGSPNMTGKIK